VSLLRSKLDILFSLQNSKDQDIQNSFPVFFLCVYEKRFLALREEHRMRVFENRVLRRIFGCKSEEVMAG